MAGREKATLNETSPEAMQREKTKPVREKRKNKMCGWSITRTAY